MDAPLEDYPLSAITDGEWLTAQNTGASNPLWIWSVEYSYRCREQDPKVLDTHNTHIRLEPGGTQRLYDAGTLLTLAGDAALIENPPFDLCVTVFYTQSDEPARGSRPLPLIQVVLDVTALGERLEIGVLEVIHDYGVPAAVDTSSLRS